MRIIGYSTRKTYQVGEKRREKIYFHPTSSLSARQKNENHNYPIRGKHAYKGTSKIETANIWEKNVILRIWPILFIDASNNLFLNFSVK